MFDFILKGGDLSSLSRDLSFQYYDYFVFLFDGAQQFLLIVLEELYFFEESGQHAFIFVVFDYLLVVFYFVLIALETLFYFVHVIFVGVNKLGLLPFEHVINFVL